MNSWRDLRIWMSGFLAALAVAAFIAATWMRVRGRARRDEEHALPKRPAARVDVPAQEKEKTHRA